MMSQVLTSYEKELQAAAMPAGRKKVLLAAIHLFAQQGFSATTTAQIAKEAGVSEGTIYKYFSSKKKLLSQLLLPMMEEIRNHFFTTLNPNLPLEEFVKSVIDDRLKFASQNFELVQILLQEVMTNINQLSAVSELMEGPQGLFQRIRQLQQHYSAINQSLTPVQIIRIFLAPMLAYILQVRLLKITSPDDSIDRRIIQQQIIAGLTAK